jgi:hypothetical protein
VPSVHADPLTGIDPDSPLFRRRAPKVILSSNPDVATEQTVQVMCELVHQAAKDPLVKTYARNAMQRFARCSKNPAAEAIWWWCKHALRFKHHGEQFEAWSAQLGDPQTKLQLLIAPDVLLRMRKMEGDCAIYTMMVCALLEALGIRWQICPCAVNHTEPEIFTHVFARAVFGDGTFESLDASHGPAPGWQVPQRDMLRLWIFDESGRRVNVQGRFQGFGDYRRSKFRGMGQDPADVEEGGDYIPPGPINPTQQFGTDLGWDPSGGTDWGGFPTSGGGYQAPSRESSQWAQFATNLAKMGFTLAQINSIQPGTVVGPNGQILRQNPGYSVPVGSTISANLGSSSSILYIGLAVVAIVAVGSMFKGGR